MLIDNLNNAIAAGSLIISAAGFLFGLCKWALSRIDKIVDSVKTEMVISLSSVKQELLFLRTNDLQHIYAELRDIRKEKKSA